MSKASDDYEAARDARQGAESAVPPAGEPGNDQQNEHLRALKRRIAADRVLQERLARSQNEDEFNQTVAAIGAEDGFSVTPEQIKAFVSRTRQLRAESPEPPPTPATSSPKTMDGCDCPDGYTHDGPNACTWNIYGSC